MFSPEIFSFISDLKANNNRDWFLENKPRYQACRENFTQNIELVINLISQFDSSVAGLEPKQCIFRINRDIRFSKDKSPYKTNFGAFIAPGGRNRNRAGYYLHLEPGNAFLAGGIYMPPSPVLKAIRQEIFENFDEFYSIVTDKDFVEHYKGIDAEKLKTKPKDFPADFEGIEYLKFKHYIVAKSVSDNSFTSDKFISTVDESFRALHPFNKFLNYAINNLEG